MEIGRDGPLGPTARLLVIKEFPLENEYVTTRLLMKLELHVKNIRQKKKFVIKINVVLSMEDYLFGLTGILVLNLVELEYTRELERVQTQDLNMVVFHVKTQIFMKPKSVILNHVQ